MSGRRPTAGSTSAAPNARLIFRPSPSLGWLSLLLIALLVLIPAALGGIAALRSPPLALIAVLPAILIGAGLLLLVVLFPTMRYELDHEALTLTYGPLLRYRIPLTEIEGIERRNLRVTVWSSLRLPGLALFTVPYGDVGRVRMCATRAAERVTLIRTADRLYGVTPADEGVFVSALRARLP